MNTISVGWASAGTVAPSQKKRGTVSARSASGVSQRDTASVCSWHWMLGLARGVWDGEALNGVVDLFLAEPASVSRMAFGQDGMLYVSTFGGLADSAQDPNNLAGKVLRLTDEGKVPPDNPFVGKGGYRPEIFTLGHRSTLGLAVRPGTNEVWENENGPNGGDEINVLKPGANYGWPLVSLGRTYPGPWQSAHPRGAKSVAPCAAVPLPGGSPAPSGAIEIAICLISGSYGRRPSPEGFPAGASGSSASSRLYPVR